MTEPSQPIPLSDKAFDPYAKEIGFLLREWNNLQERLADLFTTILGIPNGGIARTIWYAVPNDRFQRRILSDISKYLFAAHPDAPKDDELDKKQLSERRLNAAIWEEIKWIVESADKLGQRRDAAAHSPVELLLDEPLKFIAETFFENPLAKSLHGKELLSEFRLYRDRAAALSGHAKVIEQHIRFGKEWTFPKRPAWPEGLPERKGADQNRKAPAKQRTRPPSPSQA